MNEFAALLYDKVNNLEQEGLKIRVPYAKNTSHFQDVEIMEKSDLEVELIISLFFYADRVFKGLDTKKRQNWVGIFHEKNNLMSTDYPPCFKTPT
jgi:hypothetical protein